MQSQKDITSCYPHVFHHDAKDWLEKGQGHVVQASPADLWKWKLCFGAIWLVLRNGFIPQNRFVLGILWMTSGILGMGGSMRTNHWGLLRPGFLWTSGSNCLCCCKACSCRILRLLAGGSGRPRRLKLLAMGPKVRDGANFDIFKSLISWKSQRGWKHWTSTYSSLKPLQFIFKNFTHPNLLNLLHVETLQVFMWQQCVPGNSEFQSTMKA